MAKKIPNLTGQVFYRLTVLGPATRNNKAAWNCRCACGTVKVIAHGHLVEGRTRSCGCLQKEVVSARASAGGASVRDDTKRAYNIYLHMLDRCRNPNSGNYKNYGGRGIQVCKSWQESFDNFISDMGIPEKDATLDRLDNDQGYSKENCRWATKLQQNTNKRTTVNLTYNGKTQAVSEWAKELGIHPATLYSRLSSSAFTSVSEILSTPPDKSHKKHRVITANGISRTVKEWAAELGCSSGVILSRLCGGWSEERAVMEKPHIKGKAPEGASSSMDSAQPIT